MAMNTHTARAHSTSRTPILRATRALVYVDGQEEYETCADVREQRGLWVTLAAVPIFYFTYNVATGQPGALDSMYQRYKEGKEDNARRELLHVAGQQQAIADKAQMKSTPRNMNGPETRNPEYVTTTDNSNMGR